MTLTSTLETARAACATATSQTAYLNSPALIASGVITTPPARYIDVQLVDAFGSRDRDGEAFAELRITVTAWSREYGEPEVTIETIRTALEAIGWQRITTRNRGLDADYYGISLDLARLT